MHVIKLGTVEMSAAHILSVVAEIGDTVVVEIVGEPVVEDVEDQDPGPVHSKEDPVEGPVPNLEVDLKTDTAVIQIKIHIDRCQGIAQYQNQEISDLLQEKEGRPLVLAKDQEAAPSLAPSPGPSLAPNLNPALDQNQNRSQNRSQNPDRDLPRVTEHQHIGQLLN